MYSRVMSVLSSVRNPEYTGDNRCLPCTLVNVAIGTIAAAIAARRSRRAAAVVFGASMASIYARGYLVPGTPTLTKRYLPDWFLAAFEAETGTNDPGLEPASESPADDPKHEFELAKQIEYAKANKVDPDEFLTEVGAIRTDADDEETELTDEFATLVETHVSRVQEAGVDREDIVVLFDVDPDDIKFKDRDYPAITVSRRVRKWPADGALVVDVGTDRALRELTERWPAVPIEQRLEILESLRLLKEECPSCGGDVELSEETVESCCRMYPVVALRCAECGLQITELPEAEAESGSVAWDLSGDPGVVRSL